MLIPCLGIRIKKFVSYPYLKEEWETIARAFLRPSGAR